LEAELRVIYSAPTAAPLAPPINPGPAVAREEELNLALRHGARAFVEPARGEDHAHYPTHRGGRLGIVHLVRPFWTELRYKTCGKGGLIWLNILR
jgi:hypothetical protein